MTSDTNSSTYDTTAFLDNAGTVSVVYGSVSVYTGGLYNSAAFYNYGSMLVAGGSLSVSAASGSNYSSLQNSGTLAMSSGNLTAGYLHNSGILSLYNGLATAQANADNTGTITIGYSAKLLLDAAFSNAGSVIVNGGTVDAKGSFANAAGISIQAGTLTLETTAANSGAITVGQDATLLAGSGISNSGSIVLNGGTLAIGPTSGGAFGAIGFGASGGVLSLGLPSLTTTSRWTYSVTPPAYETYVSGTYGGTIYHFGNGDTIVLTGMSYASGTGAYLLSGNTLAVYQGNETLNIQFDPAQDLSRARFTLSSAGGYAALTLCFLPGTKIATPDGERFVEHLMAGDRVLTANGTIRPIAWIGIGQVLAVRGQRSAATPVIVRKGALADTVPHHDLRVTKGHSFYLDGVLIPVEFLVNHRSICWDDRAQEVTLYHVELETHDILLANGAPAESYRDDGNRWLFRNANSGWDQPPKEPCAPVLTGGPIVDAVWRRLLDRAGPRPDLPLTDDPDLHLLADGARIDAVPHRAGVRAFSLPAVPRDLRILSRAAAPQELGLSRDPRCLGVALRKIVLYHGTAVRFIEADDPRLDAGLHEWETGNGYRWTNGDTPLALAVLEGFAGPIDLVVHYAATARYFDDGPTRRAA